MENQQQTIVTVLGMHRSGTSLVARLLNLLGVYLGEEDELTPGNEFNERGYWENENILSINDEVLRQLGGSWHTPPDFADGWFWRSDLAHLRARARSVVAERFCCKSVWGWKDPRTCLTLPFWLTVVEPTHYVVCVRSPVEVAHSLVGRSLVERSISSASHDISFEQAIELWMTYTSLALRHSSGRKRLILFYQDVLEQPVQQITRLAHFIGRSDLAQDSAFLEECVQEVALELRHHRTSEVDIVDNTDLPFAVQALYTVLRSAGHTGFERSDTMDVSLARMIDAFSMRSNYFFHTYRTVISEIGMLRDQLSLHQQQTAEMTAQHAAELAERDAQMSDIITRYEQRLNEYQTGRQSAERQISVLQSELSRERRGIGYKMLRRGRALFTSVFPHNSIQRSMYVAVRKTIARRRQTHAYGVRLPDTLTMRSGDPAYDQWLQANVPSAQELYEQRVASRRLRWQLLISIIMPVYNTPADILTRAVESVLAQSYPRWELCIVDDGSSAPHIRPLLRNIARRDRRIRVQFAGQNGGIAVASNMCLAMAQGDFVVFLDHDDELAPHALFMVAELLSRHPDADLVYSDEDKITPNGTREQHYFKPDFSYDLLLSYNYICHLLALRRRLVLDINGFRTGYDGAQDYDLVLRAVERIPRSRIFHIPDVLYHWRMIEGSTSVAYQNKPKVTEVTLRLLDEHLTRTLGKGYGEVVFRSSVDIYLPKYVLKSQPLVSIIIGTRDKAGILQKCIDSLAATTYPYYEIVIVNNASREAATLDYFESLTRDNSRVRVIDYPHPFNYSALNNTGIRHAQGDVIVLLNNDTELLTPGWLEIMLGYVQQQRVGAAGVKLLYPNGTIIQHAGIVVGIGGVAGHSHKYFPGDSPGYARLLYTVRNYSAVTAACMMFRRAVWEEVGGLNEQLKVAFNDVDFCLRIGATGYDIVYIPHVQLLHHESLSVGRPHLDERQIDLSEIEYMKQHWQHVIEDDPFYNPNLTLDTEDYALHPRRWREMREHRRGRVSR